jgi:hypothetical protein
VIPPDVEREGKLAGEALLVSVKKTCSRKSAVAAMAFGLRAALEDLSPDERVTWLASALEIIGCTP